MATNEEVQAAVDQAVDAALEREHGRVERILRAHAPHIGDRALVRIINQVKSGDDPREPAGGELGYSQ